MLDPFAPGLSVAEADRLHAHLRAAGPVVEATDADGLRVWIITRYDDVSRLLADPGIVNVRPGGPSGSPVFPYHQHWPATCSIWSLTITAGSALWQRPRSHGDESER